MLDQNKVSTALQHLRRGELEGKQMSTVNRLLTTFAVLAEAERDFRGLNAELGAFGSNSSKVASSSADPNGPTPPAWSIRAARSVDPPEASPVFQMRRVVFHDGPGANSCSIALRPQASLTLWPGRPPHQKLTSAGRRASEKLAVSESLCGRGIDRRPGP
jgi:hypothetical protein